MYSLLSIIWNELIPNFIQNTIKFFVFSSYIPKLYKTIWASKLTNINISSILKKQILIGKEVYLWKDIYMSWNIRIWDYSFIWWNSDIQASETVNIEIWKFSSIARNCSIIASNYHQKNKITTRTLSGMPIQESWKSIKIWNDVWIGINTTILYWTTIWNGAIIWAWSIVTKNIPPYSVAVWNPAKVISYRFSEKTIQKLEDIEWWNWKIEKIVQNYDLNFDNKSLWNFE